MRTAAIIAACALASCGPGKRAPGTGPTADPQQADAPRRAPYLVTEAPGTWIAATDDAYVYWIDERGLERRPHGGPDEASELINEHFAEYAVPETFMVVVGGRVYLFLAEVVVSASASIKHEEPVELATMPEPISAFTVAPDGRVYAATRGKLSEVVAGKEPRLLATMPSQITDVIADADAVYFSTDDSMPVATPPSYYETPVLPLGAVHKIGRDGGGVTDVATEIAAPSFGSLGLYGDRVWWTSDTGPAVSSVSTSGGDVRVEVHGRADFMAIDDVSLVYKQNNDMTPTGMIVERRGEVLHVDLPPDGTWTQLGQPRLSPDWLYVTAVRYDTGATALLALPRQPQAVTIPFTLDHMFQRLVTDEHGLYWMEATRDYDGHVHIMRGNPETRVVEELADWENGASEMAVGAGQIYFDDGYTISRIATTGGDVREFDRVDTWVTGIHVHRNHVYWFDGSALYAHKRRGGAAFVVARNEGEYGYSDYGYYGEGAGDLVFDDDYVYTTGFGQGGTGVFQISERGQVKQLWQSNGSAYPGKDLVLIADELYFVSTQGGPAVVNRLTLEGELTPIYTNTLGGDAYGTDLIEAGGMLYLLAMVNGDVYELTRIDPSTGEGETVFRIFFAGGEWPTLATDGDAVYFGMEPYDAIFRIAFDAPPVSAFGWRSTDE